MNALQSWLTAPWVEILGRTLLHFIWQGAVLGALAWAVLRLAHRRSANVRYVLAGVLMLALAVSPVVTFLILSKTAPVPAMSAPMVTAQSGLRDNPPMETGPADAPAFLPVQTLPTPKLATVVPTNALARTTQLAAWWMVPFWIVGVLCMAVRLGLGWLRIQLWQRSATATLDKALLSSFQRLTQKFKLGARVRLLISHNIPGPITFGWVKPAVLLPAQMLTGLPPELLEALLAHELAHIARQDYLLNLVQSAIEVGLFYHPAVWWLGARLREIREECCDEMAVQSCGDRLTYARALASLAERQWCAEPAAAATGGNLLARISRIVGRPSSAPKSSARHLAGILILSGFAIGLILILSPVHLQAQAQTQKVASEPTATSTPAVTSPPAAEPKPAEDVMVYGEVKRPMVIKLDPAYPSWLSILIMTAGLTQWSDHTVQLIRFDKNGKKTITNFDVDEVLVKGNKDKDVQLQPGDVIVVKRYWSSSGGMAVPNATADAAADHPDQLEIETHFYEYPNSIKFQPLDDPLKLNNYLLSFENQKGVDVMSAPKITVLEGKPATITVGQQGAKLEGSDYSAHPLGVSLALKWQWNGNQIEYSGKESLTTLENISKSPTNVIQDSDLTEMLLQGNTSLNQINTFYLDEGKTTGRTRVVVVVFKDVGHSAAASAPLPAQNPSATTPDGTLTFSSVTSSPAPVQWNGNFTFAGSKALNLGTGAVAQGTGTETVTASSLPPVSADTLIDVDVASSSTYNPTRPSKPGTMTLNGVTYNNVAVKNITSTATIDAGSAGRLAISSAGPGQVSVSQGSGGLIFGKAAGGTTTISAIGAGNYVGDLNSVNGLVNHGINIPVPKEVPNETLFGPDAILETQPWRPSWESQNTFRNIPINTQSMRSGTGTLVFLGTNKTTINGSTTASTIPQPDPTVREDVTIQVPTKLNVERGVEGLVVVADKKSTESTQISIGKNMWWEILAERRIYHKGTEYLKRTNYPDIIGRGQFPKKLSMIQSGDLVQWVTPDTVDGWSDDQPYVVEFEYCLVEAPTYAAISSSGIDDTLKNTKDLRVLWQQTLSINVDDKSVGPEITYGAGKSEATPAPKAPSAPANPPPSTSSPVKHLGDPLTILKTDALTGDKLVVLGVDYGPQVKWYTKDGKEIPTGTDATASALKTETTPLLWALLNNRFVGAAAVPNKEADPSQNPEVDVSSLEIHTPRLWDYGAGFSDTAPTPSKVPIMPAPKAPKTTSTSPKPVLKPSIWMAIAGDYEFAFADGEKVPVTLETPKVYAESN